MCVLGWYLSECEQKAEVAWSPCTSPYVLQSWASPAMALVLPGTLGKPGSGWPSVVWATILLVIGGGDGSTSLKEQVLPVGLQPWYGLECHNCPMRLGGRDQQPLYRDVGAQKGDLLWQPYWSLAFASTSWIMNPNYPPDESCSPWDQAGPRAREKDVSPHFLLIAYVIGW